MLDRAEREYGVRAQHQENGTVLLALRQRPETLTVSRLHAARFKAQ